MPYPLVGPQSRSWCGVGDGGATVGPPAAAFRTATTGRAVASSSSTQLVVLHAFWSALGRDYPERQVDVIATPGPLAERTVPGPSAGPYPTP
jgi:hypothetical protein